MIFGKPRRPARALRRAAEGLLLSLALATAGASAAPWGVDSLMQRLAANGSGRARFVEHKYLAVVERPVVSSGELRYAAPDRLEKLTDKPRPESMVLSQGVLTLERGGRSQQMRLADQPEVAAFVESIRGTLTGDRAALERLYELQLEGTEARWALTLVPRQARMLGVVKRIRMEGTQAELRSVEIEQSGGDRSVMAIEKAAP